MAIDFPSNRDQLVPPQPAGPIQDGDVYIYQGTTYTAKILGIPPDDSVQWNAATSAGNEGYVLKVGDTMTGQLTLPGGGTGKQAATVDQVTAVDTASVAKAGDTMTGQLTLPGGGTGSQAATVDQVDAVSTASVAKAGDTMTGNLTVPSLNDGQIAFRNQVINGSFGINQRGISDTSAQNIYFVDRWFKGNSSGRIVVVETTPTGFDRSLSFSGAADSPIYQTVELPRTGKAGPYAVGTTWTLSCYARCASGGDVRLGKRFVNSQNQNVTDESAQAFTLDTNWKHISFTFTLGSAPNAANTGLQVLIVALTANELFVTGVQLEPGPVATPYEHRPIGTELALCQRYYLKIGNVFGLAARPASGALRVGQFAFPTTMRATPTVTGSTSYSPSYSSTTAEKLVFKTSGVSDASDHIVTNMAADAEL